MAKLKIFWQPAGITLDGIGAKRYQRHSDGDTPIVATSIRMLSVDTPELHYPGTSSPAKHDAKLADLAGWLMAGKAPVNGDLAAHLAPRLATGDAGTRHERQGEQASAAFQNLVDTRLRRPSGTMRDLFVRTADQPFDEYGRLLAYIAPNYSTKELASMNREERATFNLLMVESGWGAPFIIYPSIPNQADLELFHTAADEAVTQGKGAWADPLLLTGYEFRMVYRLWEVTSKLEKGEKLSEKERISWISRWCADMTTGLLYEPQEYFRVRPQDRLFIWPQNIRAAVAALNLIPA
ncbi:MAG: nuclease [Desulfuromonadales bacterium]|nr:MAG: nuclease [Desulfuromonadales bacterium]